MAEDAQPETIKEIHIVTFPDEAAFAAYRNDARLGPYAHLRSESVMHSEILVGTEGPVYSDG